MRGDDQCSQKLILQATPALHMYTGHIGGEGGESGAPQVVARSEALAETGQLVPPCAWRNNLPFEGETVGGHEVVLKSGCRSRIRREKAPFRVDDSGPFIGIFMSLPPFGQVKRIPRCVKESLYIRTA